MTERTRSRPIEIIPLTGIGEVVAGDDLAGILADALRHAGLTLIYGDVLVVTQKIVSKAEGRLVALDTVEASDRAISVAEITRKDPRLVELVLRESVAVLRAVPHVLITRHRLGLVMANAGIDRSNIGPGHADSALLLPVDPDRSAQRLAEAMTSHDVRPAVVISDSFGRPWRMGVVAVGIGADGIAALEDRRGHSDRDGRSLEVTQIGLADLLASAASLVTGEGSESIPAVLVRGFNTSAAPCPAKALARPLAEDLFQ